MRQHLRLLIATHPIQDHRIKGGNPITPTKYCNYSQGFSRNNPTNNLI